MVDTNLTPQDLIFSGRFQVGDTKAGGIEKGMDIIAEAWREKLENVKGELEKGEEGPGKPDSCKGQHRGQAKKKKKSHKKAKLQEQGQSLFTFTEASKKTRAPQDQEAPRLQGVVVKKMLDYGFIQVDPTAPWEENVFFHKKELQNNGLFKKIKEGDLVNCRVCETDKGPRAADVMLLEQGQADKGFHREDQIREGVAVNGSKD